MATPGEKFIRKHPLSLAVAMSLSAMAAQGRKPSLKSIPKGMPSQK